jgi:hypothetical protein
MKKTLLALTLIVAFAACKKSPAEEPVIVNPVEVEAENTNFYVSKIKETISPFVPIANTTYKYLGCGYDITGRYGDFTSVRNAVIDVNKVSTLYPGRIWISGINSSGTPKTGVAQNAEVFSQMLSNSVDATKTYKVFKKSLTSLSDSALSKKYIYGIAMYTVFWQKATLNVPVLEAFSNTFSDAFISDVNNLAPAALVQKYGTHVMDDIHLGAKLEIIYQAKSKKTQSEEKQLKANIGLSRGTIAGFSSSTGQYYSGPAYINSNTDQKLFYKTFGGDTTKLPQLPQDNALNPRMDFRNWWLSSTPANSTMIDVNESGLIPLQNFVFDSAKKVALEAYISQYIQDNSVRLID